MRVKDIEMNVCDDEGTWKMIDFNLF
jgi:hypothetical protein